MRKRYCLLLLVLLGLPNYAVATRDICGNPPPDQFREANNESIKGDLAGKANFLSGFVGKAELGGKIEATRSETFARYPDANAAYLDRYLLYMFCYVLFDPKNTQTPFEKMKALQEFERQQQQHNKSVDSNAKPWQKTWSRGGGQEYACPSGQSNCPLAGHSFWVVAQLDGSNAFWARWDYEGASGGPNSVSINMNRTASGWIGRGNSLRQHPVEFEVQDNGLIIMRWGPRIEGTGDRLHYVAW